VNDFVHMDLNILFKRDVFEINVSMYIAFSYFLKILKPIYLEKYTLNL